MDLEEYDTFCGSLQATTMVIQWGDAHVWKVGGKVFAIVGWDEDDVVDFTWVQHYASPGLEDDDLRE